MAIPGATVASPANPSFLGQADANDLAPGAYRWDPSIAPDGPMNMVVNLGAQRAFVYRDGKLIGISMIASGRPGYETPDGTFTVLEKQKKHHSNKYDDAPMPYMQRLSWSGLALHGGHPRGRPASHGCIRLPMGFAAALFKESTRGMPVVITGHAPGKEQTLMASRRKPRPPAQADDVRAAEFSNGQDEANPPEETPCCVPADGAANGAANGDLNQNADQRQNDERDSNSPQDVPPPPGG